MTRNRLDSSSMKTAVGCACLQLLFAVAGVGFSLAKVVYGSEFIHACPSRDIVPVYIVMSGIFPVLLSALKAEYDHKARCESRLKLGTATLGIVVNLSWLIAGTVWTAQLLRDSDYGQKLCSPDDEASGLLMKDSTSHIVDQPSPWQASNVTHMAISSQPANIILNNVSASDLLLSSSVLPAVSDMSDSRTNHTCFRCARHVMGFSLACVITDWIVCVLGTLFLCSFCFRRVTGIKDQLLDIKA